jgi:hypothetical protein
MYKKGVKREKQLKEIASATHKTYNNVHDTNHFGIY